MMSSRAALGAANRTAYRPPRPASSAWLARGRWSWPRTASPSNRGARPDRRHADVPRGRPEGSEREKELANGVPDEALGRPEDVAHAVMFFAVAQSSTSPARFSMSAAVPASAPLSSEGVAMSDVIVEPAAPRNAQPRADEEETPVKEQGPSSAPAVAAHGLLLDEVREHPEPAPARGAQDVDQRAST